MQKIIILLPYFGKWPDWINCFIESCKHNPSIDWLFFTDCDIPANRCDNVRFFKMLWDECCTLISGERRRNNFPSCHPGHCDHQSKAKIKNPADFVLYTASEIFTTYHLLEKPFPDWIEQLREELNTIPEKDMIAYIRSFLEGRIEDSNGNLDFTLRLLNLQLTNMRMTYRLRDKIKTHAIIARAEGSAWNGKKADLGWSKKTGGISPLAVPGNHRTMIKGDNAQIIAEAIRNRLQSPK